MDEVEKLDGGNSNQVRKQGNTVLRNTGTWSPFVHALLKFLTANGFTESPILIEASATSERLSFIDGDVGHYPLDRTMQSDEVLVQAAKLLRKFHDLTQNFVIPSKSQFQLPTENLAEYEVICHNDFAPYNCVFKDGRLVGIIDFDTAAPNTRLWDIAYAVYRFAPLVTDSHCLAMGWQSPPNRRARLKLFCDSYGLDNRAPLIETVIQRLAALVKYMQANESNLDHLPIYQADLAFIRENQSLWTLELG